jgi:hypothetical protein
MKKFTVTVEEFGEFCGATSYMRTVSKSAPVDYTTALATAQQFASDQLPQNYRVYINEVNHWNEVKHRKRVA